MWCSIFTFSCAWFLSAHFVPKMLSKINLYYSGQWNCWMKLFVFLQNSSKKYCIFLHCFVKNYVKIYIFRKYFFRNLHRCLWKFKFKRYDYFCWNSCRFCIKSWGIFFYEKLSTQLSDENEIEEEDGNETLSQISS